MIVNVAMTHLWSLPVYPGIHVEFLVSSFDNDVVDLLFIFPFGSL